MTIFKHYLFGNLIALALIFMGRSISCTQSGQYSGGKYSNKIIQGNISSSNNSINVETANVETAKEKSQGDPKEVIRYSELSAWRETGIRENLDNLSKYQPTIAQITIIENSVADKEFENLYNGRKPLRYYLPKGTNCEFEIKLCEETIRTKCCVNLCIDVPNPCEIEMLGNIYKQYPDSEAAATALLMIARSLWGGDFGSGYMSLKEESDNIIIPIIKKYYPNTWQRDMADYVVALGKLKSRNSLDKLPVLYDAIKSFEVKNVLNNKIYQMYMGGENGIALLYFDISEVYFYNGYEKGRDSISHTGQLSPESIELCKKGMENFAIGHNKYPDSEDMRYNRKGYPMHVAWANRCFDMINRTGDFKDR